MRRTVACLLHRAVLSATNGNTIVKSATSNFHRLMYFVPTRCLATTRCLSTTTKMKGMPNLLMGKEDRYRGLHVELQHEMSSEEFDEILELSVAQWMREDKLAVWLDVPISLSHYIPVAARHGFLFHHAEGDSSTLYKWLSRDLPCMIPRFATHQVGVAGCIVREDTKEVLVIQDKHRTFQLWKFPGGLADLGEDLSQTAEREVFEETGIRSEFQGILTFRQQHNIPGAFGRSDIYFLCYMKPLTYELRPDTNEILKCNWMKIEDLQADRQTSAMTHRVVELLKTGLEHGFDKVVLAHPEFKSVYKGVNYKLHHVDIGLPNLSPSAYRHYVSSNFPRD